jgi:glycosyltransferase involved in cell wall biosynthesis
MKKSSQRKNMLLEKNLVFLPSWNEEQTVGQIVLEIHRCCPDFDVLVIDDGSDDSTGSKALAAGAKVLRLPINVGVGGAIKCALRYASENSYSNLFQVDADGQHDPRYISSLLGELTAGADLVIGTRFGGNSRYVMGTVRRLTIRLLSKIMEKFIDVEVSDPTSGFRGFNRKAIEALRLDFPTEYLGDTVECLLLAHHAGLKIVEVPVEMRIRQAGEPSNGPLKSFGYLIRALFAIVVSQFRHAITTRQNP